ncbi:MAG TPA: hypothetical protein VFM00_08350, partial [Candidatus Eisenbacteria bacterium]|nr:hypothetical protein [Candidatus Eisenbacteria bacterium]
MDDPVGVENDVHAPISAHEPRGDPRASGPPRGFRIAGEPERDPLRARAEPDRARAALFEREGLDRLG